jgi:hypothetical protein
MGVLAAYVRSPSQVAALAGRTWLYYGRLLPAPNLPTTWLVASAAVVSPVNFSF